MHGGSGGGSDYTVDRKGYVANMGGNNKTYDILYASDAYAAGDYSNGLVIKDTSILPSLNQKDPYFNGNYVISNDFEEMASLFLFMANNTDVEWRFDGYRTSDKNVNEYIVATSHNANTVACLLDFKKKTKSLTYIHIKVRMLLKELRVAVASMYLLI